MPGPLMKNPNTSLYCEPTHSLYSSLANVKSKRRESPVGMMSNSNLHASYVVRPVTRLSSGSPGVPAWKVLLPALFGPSASLMRPVVSSTPSLMDMPLPA